MTDTQIRSSVYRTRRRGPRALVIFVRVVVGTILALATAAFFLAPWLTFEK